MKQFRITILLTMLMSMFGSKAFAHDIEVANNDGVIIYYKWANEAKTELAVSYRGSKYDSYSNEYTGNVIIPESVDYNGNTYPVTSIGSYAFSYCFDLTSVTIPNSVTSIGESAFSTCSGLATIVSEIKTPFGIGNIVELFYSVTVIVPVGTKADYQSRGWSMRIVEVGEGGLVGSRIEIEGIYYSIRENNTAAISSVNRSISGALEISSQVDFNGKKYDVTSIGFEVFHYCSDLTSVTIPGSVTSIGEWAFDHCTGLTSITIPNSVTSIGSNAFQNCTNLTSVTIPSSVTSISDQTFYYCTSLTSVTIPNSVTSIGSNAFLDCIKLASVTIPYSVTSIGNAAFANCRGLTSVTIPSSVTSIGSSAFSGCKGLTSIIIPDKVTSINDYTFEKCSGLTSVTIPKNITSIGESAFKDCSGLNTIISEIETPFEIGYIADYSATLIVPAGTKAAYQSTAGWSSFTKILEVGEGGFVGYKFEVDGIYYTIGENNTAALDYANRSISGAVEIPSQVEFNGKKYDVTSIGEWTFANCTGLTSITIPNSVTSIGSEAFSLCSALTSVTIPNSVTSIGGKAFEYCSGLTSVKVPVTDYSAFCNNKVINLIRTAIGKLIQLIDNEGTEITEYIVPNDVTSIGESAFRGCSGLTSVTIGNSVSSIGESAFNGCSGLTSVTIPNSVTSIGEYAFYNCNGLASVTIPNSVTSISNSAFNGCSGLTSVKVPVTDFSAFCNNKVINIIRTAIGKPIQLIDNEGIEITEYIVPNDVTSIGESAFTGCIGLTSVTIGNSVSSIGESAFNGCSGLTSVIIGSGVLSIGSSAFSNTNLKKTIWLTNTPPSGYNNAKGTVNYVSNDQFGISNQVVYKYLSSHFVVDGIRYVPVSPSDRTCDAIDCTYDVSIENINIGETVTNKGVTLTVMKVNLYTCYGNKHIKEVKLSFGGDIGDYAFYECAGLATATVSNKGAIGANAFRSCPALKTATISNQGNIEKNAFESCSAMTIVNITCQGDIGENAFQSCSALTTATINNQGGIGGAAFSGCSLLETAELGQNVTSIGSYAFNGCSKMKSIVIPDAVNALGSYAFQNCAVMTSAKTGNGIETIDEYTFSGCSSLNEINIGSKVKNINQYAFSGCSALPSITIPQAVTKIGNNAFSECTSLAKVTIADSETTLTLGSNGSSPIFSSCPLDYVYIGRDISYKTSSSYGYSPFYRNTTLREVKTTDKETEISENEFYGCTNLQTVTIGDGVTAIGNWAFSGCQSLKFFTFGSEVKTIGQEAFSDCSAVTEITSRAITPPTCGNQALDDINKWECKLYVPKGHLADYQAAEQWKEFFFVEEGDMVITPIKESITISSAKQVTYMSDKNLNFTDYPDLKAYVATGYDKASGTIWLTRVKEVPANTGFLLMGDAGDYEIPVKKGDPISYYMNLFKGTIEGTTIQTTEGDYTNYYLSNGDAGVGFYKVQSSVTLKANRAYLSVPTEIPAVGSEGSTETIKVSSAGQVPYYNTASLDFSSLDAQGVKAYTATGYDYSTGTIWLTRVKQVPAETGILIMAPQGEYPVPTASVASVYANMFKGTLTGTTIYTHETIVGEDYINYYLSSGDAGVGFYKVTKEGGVTIGANRCYLPIKNKEAAGTRSAGSGQSQIAFEEADEVIGIPLFRSIDGDEDGTTSIKNLTPALSKGEGEGEWYTLQGQRVNKPGKGIYIRNGRKVVIK